MAGSKSKKDNHVYLTKQQIKEIQHLAKEQSLKFGRGNMVAMMTTWHVLFPVVKNLLWAVSQESFLALSSFIIQKYCPSDKVKINVYQLASHFGSQYQVCKKLKLGPTDGPYRLSDVTKCFKAIAEMKTERLSVDDFSLQTIQNGAESIRFSLEKACPVYASTLTQITFFAFQEYLKHYPQLTNKIVQSFYHVLSLLHQDMELHEADTQRVWEVMLPAYAKHIQTIVPIAQLLCVMTVSIGELYFYSSFKRRLTPSHLNYMVDSPQPKKVSELKELKFDSEKEARDYVDKVRQMNVELQWIAIRGEYLFNILCVLLVGYLNYDEDNRYTSSLCVMPPAMYAIGSLISHLFDGAITQYYDDRQFLRLQNNVREMFKHVVDKVKFNRTQTLMRSQIIVYIQSKKKEKLFLSSVTLTAMINQILLKNKIELELSDEGSDVLMIDGDLDLTLENAKKIKSEISTAIDAEFDLLRLHEQFIHLSVLQKFSKNEKFVKPNEMQRKCEWSFTIPTNKIDIDQFRSIFSACEIEIDEIDQHYHIHVSGVTPVEEVIFKNFIDQFKQKESVGTKTVNSTKQMMASIDASNDPEYKLSYIRKLAPFSMSSTTTTTAAATSSFFKPVEQQESRESIIDWGDGYVYNPNEPRDSAQIVQLQDSTLKNPCYLMIDLNSDVICDSTSRLIYEKANTAIRNAVSILPEKAKKPGICYLATPQLQKDSYGNNVCTHVKIRLLDALGDVRVYGYKKEVANKVLYVFSVIKYKAHKEEERHRVRARR